MKFDRLDRANHRYQNYASNGIEWSCPEATAGQRLVAYVIDFVLLTVVMGFIEALLKVFSESSSSSSFQGALTVLYFLYMHAYLGQTVGKKVVGLRVVPFDSNQPDELAPKGKVALREFAGRILNMLTLGIGYLMIFFREDRRGLHDLIGGTRVIALEDAKEIKGRYVFATLALVTLVGAGGFYYVSYFTALPLQAIAKTFEARGWTIEGVSGSLKSGIVVDRIATSLDGDAGHIELTGLHLHVEQTNLPETQETLFLVHNFTIESAKLQVTKWPEKKHLTDQAKLNSAKSKNQNKAVPKFQVDNLDLNRLELMLPNGKNYDLKRLVIQGFKNSSEGGTLSLTRLFLQSDYTDIDIHELSISPEEKVLSLNKPSYLILKPAIYPEMLKAPIDIKFQANIADKTFHSLDIAAFRNKVSVKWEREQGELAIKSWTPAHYFKTQAPIGNIDFKISGNPMKAMFRDMQGSLGLRNSRFALRDGIFVHSRGQEVFVLVPDLSRFKAAIVGEAPLARLMSAQHPTGTELLSSLYFNKPSSQLVDKERDLIARDLRFFAVSAPGLPPSLTPGQHGNLRSPTAIDPRMPGYQQRNSLQPLNSPSQAVLPRALPSKQGPGQSR